MSSSAAPPRPGPRSAGARSCAEIGPSCSTGPGGGPAMMRAPAGAGATGTFTMVGAVAEAATAAVLSGPRRGSSPEFTGTGRV